MSTLISKQWQISLFSGLIFLLISLPSTYELTGNLYHKITGSYLSKMNHLYLHVAVFMLITKWTMTWHLF